MRAAFNQFNPKVAFKQMCGTKVVGKLHFKQLIYTFPASKRFIQRRNDFRPTISPVSQDEKSFDQKKNNIAADCQKIVKETYQKNRPF